MMCWDNVDVQLIIPLVYNVTIRPAIYNDTAETNNSCAAHLICLSTRAVNRSSGLCIADHSFHCSSLPGCGDGRFTYSFPFRSLSSSLSVSVCFLYKYVNVLHVCMLSLI